MSAAGYLVPRLKHLASRLRGALRRVNEASDDEAVHDMRVALRKLRSLLKPARPILGGFHTDAVRAALKSLADATGELRDEEVLRETVGGLSLPPDAQGPRQAWMTARRAREDGLRAALLSMLRAGRGDQAASLLDALLLLPVDPRRDEPLAAFSRAVVLDAAERVERASDAEPADSEALHRLRIEYKRLRYASEGFFDALPPELAGLSHQAATFQKILGEIHDLDVAIAVVSSDAHLAPEPQRALLTALAQTRAQAVRRYQDQRTVPPDSDPAPPSLAFPPEPGAAAPDTKAPTEPTS